MFGTAASSYLFSLFLSPSNRRQFFYDVVVVLPSLEKPARKKRRLSPEEALAAEPLPVVEDASAHGLSAALTADELERLEEVEEKTLNELRIFLREVLGRLLRDRRFSIFSRPIDPDTVPDYFEIIKVRGEGCVEGLF